jgi:RNA polymerase sigma factor (sigma-70 family)
LITVSVRTWHAVESEPTSISVPIGPDFEDPVTHDRSRTNEKVCATTESCPAERDDVPRNLLNAEPESGAPECAARIRAAVEEEHQPLLRSIAVLVARSDPRLRWSEVMEIASEVLHEAVQEALQGAPRFDPTRSAVAWVRGIAAKRLLGRRRLGIRIRRCVPASVLGQEAWAAALGQLRTGPADATVASRLDLEQALNRLAPGERQAVECRYYRGLDGQALANALGVSTPGAARVRVCRALQALRTHLAPGGAEVLP